MFVSNINNIQDKIKVSKKIADKLRALGFPVMGYKGNSYYFSDTERVRVHIKRIKDFLEGGETDS